MNLTLNKLIEIAKEHNIDFDKPILWHKSEKGSNYVQLGMSDHTKENKNGRLRYLGTISKGGYFFFT